jgi:1-acyl-sn-glycerol-3-phosphate acyltransferase
MFINRVLTLVARALLVFVGRLRVVGREKVPPAGPYLLVTNHMSKADPPLLLLALPRVRIRFFAAEKWQRHLLFGTLLKWGGAVFIQRGEVDRKALRHALDALAEGSIFGLAPEGTRSRIGALIAARDGAAFLALKSKALLLPVGIANSDAIANNLGRLRRTHMELRFGDPFTLPELPGRARGSDLAACTHYIMIHIAALLPERHWGYYSDSPALRAYLRGEDPWPFCLAAEAQPEPDEPSGLTE